MLTGAQGYNDTMQAQIADGETTTNEAIKMAAVVISTAPILAVYPLFQKYFIHGMYMGAVKG
jgi:putative aldouronate transport system permease protein